MYLYKLKYYVKKKHNINYTASLINNYSVFKVPLNIISKIFFLGVEFLELAQYLMFLKLICIH